MTQLGNFNNKNRDLNGSSRPLSHKSSVHQSLAPLDQPMRTSPSESSSVSYSKSNTFNPTRTSSSSLSRNGTDIDTDSYEDPNNSYDDGDCECMDTALQILEEVVIPPVGADWAMAENTILFLKNNISRCITLSQCRGCRQDSGICMLTLVIYEKLTTGFEDVAQWWDKQGQPQGERNHHQLQQQQGKQQPPQQQQILSGSRQI